MKITQRDLVESIQGLRDTARDLRDAGARPRPDGTVLVQVEGLVDAAQYLEKVAEELTSLIPDRPVPALPE